MKPVGKIRQDGAEHRGGHAVHEHRQNGSQNKHQHPGITDAGTSAEAVCARMNYSGCGAAWLARLLGVQEVPGSNPGSPTTLTPPLLRASPVSAWPSPAPVA